MALDKDNSLTTELKFENEYDKINFDKEFNNLSWRKESLDNPYDKQSSQGIQGMEVEEYQIDIDKLRKYSADDELMREPELRKRTLSIIMDRINGNYKINIR